ncbi:uncharacterized protein [Primulina huaijiensis]|uniref:uncharacterized protein isoform X2 n=1 Tax=Primulina huaijiensis TaxID=1492673 RepID=UPI003CC73459
MAQSATHSENVVNSGALLSEEYEHVPLKQRLKMLMATHSISFDSVVKLESEIPELTPNTIGSVARKRGNKHSNSQMIETVMRQEKHAVKVEEGVDSQATKCSYSYSLPGIQQVNFGPETSDQFRDELDHVVLKERLSKSLELQSKLEKNSSEISVSVSESGNKQSAGRVGQLSSCHQKLAVPETGVPYARDSLGIQREDSINFSEKIGSIYESDCGKALLSGSITPAQDSTKQKLANIKVEPPNCHEFESFNVTTVANMSFSHLVSMKEEVDNLDDLYETELDHMLLRDRMKLLSSKNVPRMNIHQNSERLSTTVPSALNSNTGPSKPIQSLKVNRPRKRRKTVTDSIEIAMEEDAPGLLQVLIEKGVSLDEIKLYGESESKDALDDSSTEDNFSELEAVISKLFMQRESLLRLGPLRCGKGEKASYCLACLFSLVEQARYLQFRNWPVEWGWCRDLQSFIFVFERHNRIVLERPEYGYATYFFELAASLPIHWQIKRLVTAMKLTSCGRVTLLENKALMVGEDLTEGEARVLTEFGWIPNTGLGTMLNYFDRVVHDRKNEKYSSSEWSSKIGKLLMDGYNGGTIISAGIPNSVTEYNGEHSMQIKLELDPSQFFFEV